ncbi:MAG: hypothetical protein IPP40_07465 [bacterium]|nr:hypothetical protein [bacterium]
MSVVAGGDANSANSLSSAVGGGSNNVAGGQFSAIPGGAHNFAGDYSLAAGQQAHADHRGSFVWGDSRDTTVSTTANDQFIARASGGVKFFTDSAMTHGVYLDPESGCWLSVETGEPCGGGGDLALYQQDADTNSFDATKSWGAI